MELIKSLISWEKNYKVHKITLPHIFLHLDNEVEYNFYQDIIKELGYCNFSRLRESGDIRFLD